jgi:hypothetical protein
MKLREISTLSEKERQHIVDFAATNTDRAQMKWMSMDRNGYNGRHIIYISEENPTELGIIVDPDPNTKHFRPHKGCKYFSLNERIPYPDVQKFVELNCLALKKVALGTLDSMDFLESRRKIPDDLNESYLL